MAEFSPIFGTGDPNQEDAADGSNGKRWGWKSTQKALIAYGALSSGWKGTTVRKGTSTDSLHLICHLLSINAELTTDKNTGPVVTAGPRIRV